MAIKKGEYNCSPFRLFWKNVRIMFVLAVFIDFSKCKILKNAPICRTFRGADYGTRTRHLNLGKVALYRMS